MLIFIFFFFFFKQKTAYEVTEGDWSSDVCSSDLLNSSHPQSKSRRRRNVILLGMGGATISIAAGLFLLPRAVAHKVDKSIAVLPFENLSDDQANAYFADGVQDDVLTNLS